MEIAATSGGTQPGIGQTVSHYRIERKLGQGGMGVVYRATDTRLNRTVALKMLLPELAADQALRRRLANEARAASALNHPVIATVHDFEQTGDHIFIVYEYVEGATLRDVMTRRSLEFSEWLSACIKIADGLAAAHNAGITHRDLKPENIMLDDSGRVKILDFGLAKLHRPIQASESTAGPESLPAVVSASGTVVGTVNYMSPEQLEAQPVDQRSDVFSFGIILYELATGRHPFAGRSPLSTVGNILKEEPPPIRTAAPQLPQELGLIIAKCLRKNRWERYQSTRDLLVDLEALRRNSTSGAAASALPGELYLPRNVARGLLLLIQIGYLAMYVAALANADRLVGLPAVLALAMCGIVVRLYLTAAVGFDHPATGAQFRWLFLPLLGLDSIWALSPLLLFRRFGWLMLGAVAAMAYLPFCQRTLIQSAYRWNKSPE